MVDLDLDIITKKQKTIKLFGKEVLFKNLTMEEYLECEILLKSLDDIPLIDEDSIKAGTKVMYEYLERIIELDPEDVKKITMKQFKAIRKFLERQEAYEQGFTDKEIDQIEKISLKKQMAQIK